MKDRFFLEMIYFAIFLLLLGALAGKLCLTVDDVSYCIGINWK